jgi:predicted nucleotidyltransferase
MNNNFGLRPDDLLEIRRMLSHYPEVQEAILFGSRAKGNYRNGSDVDLALKGSKLTQHIISHIADALNEETRMPYQFDVLNYHSIHEPKLVEHIDRVGKRIYPNNLPLT